MRRREMSKHLSNCYHHMLPSSNHLHLHPFYLFHHLLHRHSLMLHFSLLNLELTDKPVSCHSHHLIHCLHLQLCVRNLEYLRANELLMWMILSQKMKKKKKYYLLLLKERFLRLNRHLHHLLLILKRMNPKVIPGRF